MLNTTPIEHSVTDGGGTLLDQRMSNLFHEVMPQRKLSNLKVQLPNKVQLEPRNRFTVISLIHGTAPQRQICSGLTIYEPSQPLDTAYRSAG